MLLIPAYILNLEPINASYFKILQKKHEKKDWSCHCSKVFMKSLFYDGISPMDPKGIALYV